MTPTMKYVPNFLRQSIEIQTAIETACEIYYKFWQQHPCLLYGLVLLLADAVALTFHPFLLFPFILLFFPLITFKYASQALLQKYFLALLLFISAYFYIHTLFLTPHLTYPAKGKGYFIIHSVSEPSHKYGNKRLYKGKFEYFKNEKGEMIAKNIPCIVTQGSKLKENPLASCNYLIPGILTKNNENHSYFLKSTDEWSAIKYTFNFSEWRFIAKKFISKYIESSVSATRSAIFLKGISTGEFNDTEMKFELSRFGLQHIMAISGFHFAIVASFFSFLLNFFLSRKKTALILIFVLSSYFMFLGANPSVMRAWIMVLIMIVGILLEQKSYGINSLGIALFLILAIDPQLIRNMGFQFSMSITLSILMTYQIFDKYIQALFPKRKLYDVIEMSFLDKHGYCLITWIRKAIALTLSVNIVALPLSLYYFQKFPLLGLVYNWFFPFLVSLSIILLILALLFFFIPPIAHLFHLVNDTYTHFLLNFAYNLPKCFDMYYRTKLFSFESTLVFITLVFFWAIFEKNKIESQKDFAFI